jgi:hypothetical protein
MLQCNINSYTNFGIVATLQNDGNGELVEMNAYRNMLSCTSQAHPPNDPQIGLSVRQSTSLSVPTPPGPAVSTAATTPTIPISGAGFLAHVPSGLCQATASLSTYPSVWLCICTEVYQRCFM